VKRILLYAPDVIGHPRVYCRVIADALSGRDCELVVAMGFSRAAGLEDSPDLQPLVGRTRLQLIGTSCFSSTGRTNLQAEELVRLQERYAIDTTLFIEADKSNAEFWRIGHGSAPPLRGRNLGIFAATSEWYPGENSYSGERLRLLGPTVRTTLGNVKRAVLNRRDTPRYFYESIIIKRRVLDEILVKDERLAQQYGPPVFWMPEISSPVSAPESPEDAAEYGRRRTELQRFLAANCGRHPALYFGDAAYYKGYDLFLAFVASTPEACAIHAGRPYEARELSRFSHDADVLRTQLLREGRLYETRGYVHTRRLKELFFSAIDVYLTTHRLALSSSTMIQAIHLGKPVLVPDRGLLGHRVRANGLGEVYRYGDLDDLRAHARSLWRAELSAYVTATRAFSQRFSDVAVRDFFVGRLLGGPSATAAPKPRRQAFTAARSCRP
jgi:hypothetical protein